jgi:hypothetical protein
VIVLAKSLNSGVARIKPWGDRTKFYNDELAISTLEEISLELVFWLEELGYPAIIVPPTHVDPWRYRDDPTQHMTTLLSLPHAAVEAGLGTLGLNLQLLTPEFGPRVILTASCRRSTSSRTAVAPTAFASVPLTAAVSRRARPMPCGIGTATGRRAMPTGHPMDSPS